MNDGVSERQSARGRAEVIGSKDLMVIYHEDVKRACYSDNFDCLYKMKKKERRVSKESCIFYK